MKSLKFMLSVALLSLSTGAFAQSQAQPQTESKPQTQAPAKVQTEAQKSFEKLKSLEGVWEGRVALDTKDFGQPKSDLVTVTLRVTSRGNALMHEIKGDAPDDPITMFYLDQDRLLLTHFCDAGNRPRMTGKLSADGKILEFDFLDISGKMLTHHMQRGVFTFVDLNHHNEEWTFQMGDHPVHARMELQRVDKKQALVR